MMPKQTPRPVPAPESDDILDLAGAAEVLHISPSHMSNLVNGKIKGLPPVPHVKAGRAVRIRRRALMRWFAEQEQASQRSAAE